VRWAGDSVLVYLGERIAYPRPCPTCARDTLRWGADIVVMSWETGTVAQSAIPGGADASSVAVDPSGDTLYYTRNGEPRVYRFARATGSTTVVHDFGAGIARDVGVGPEAWLVAVIGGRVSYAVDAVLGPVQADDGGDLVAVDRETGQVVPLAGGGRWFRRPAIAPDGRHVVAQGAAYAIAGTDTVVAPSDLWVFALP
jgi:DNA-binding beta-propeller fold protein YncE